MIRIRTLITGVALLGAALLISKQTDVFSLVRTAATTGKQPDASWLVVSNQLVRPWGEQFPIKGRPVDLAFDSQRRLLAVLNSAGVMIVDGSTSIPLYTFKTKTTSYSGIAFRRGDREVWASEATRNGPDSIFIGKLTEAGLADGMERIELPGHPVPAGIAFTPDGSTAYVALSRNNSVLVVDAATRRVKREVKIGLAPFAVAVSPVGGRIFVTCRGGPPAQPGASTAPSSGTQLATDARTGSVLEGTVSVVEPNDYSVTEVVVGRGPSGMAMSPDGKTIVVANGHSDTLTTIDTQSLALATIPIPTWPAGLMGSQPAAIAFSSDGMRLYVACSGDNAITVLSRKERKWMVVGAFPVGYFPSAIAIDAKGDLRIANVKGVGNTANGSGAFTARAFEGSLVKVPAPSEAQLTAGAREVRLANNPKFESAGGVKNLSSLGIQHVFLIVKENRTYDQVFGDMPRGNNDPKLAIYGREITPNHHALAEKYVQLDNFYATGAISFEGHQWLAQGFVSDHVERALGSAPRGYAWNMSDSLTVSPEGFFWQHGKKPIDVRLFGVLALPMRWDSEKRSAVDIDEHEIPSWSEHWKMYKSGKWQHHVGSRAAVPALAPMMATKYPVNSMHVPDQIRADVLLAELAEAEKAGKLPNLLVIGMTSDHTMGTNPAAPTPSAMVADNDLAMGRMVEAITKSRFWPKSLILIVEDDAQDGIDHVDGHRTVALAVGPTVRRNVLDSNFYTQLSMVRTIQDVFKIEPRTRFLKAARPMTSLFTADRDMSPYKAIVPKVALDTMNTPLKALQGRQLRAARQSAAMNWNEVDDVPSADLNRILWWDRKGYGVPVPTR